MTTWIALLRGINVGGHNRLPMAELRALCAGVGFEAVQTYIQSGNVVLKSSLSEDAVGGALRAGIEGRFGLAIGVVVRSRSDLERIVAAPAFSDTAHLAVAFLDAVPSAAAVRRLHEGMVEPAQCRVEGRDVQLLLPGGFSTPWVQAPGLDRRLGVSATARNWRTVRRLADLAAAAAAA